MKKNFVENLLGFFIFCSCMFTASFVCAETLQVEDMEKLSEQASKLSMVEIISSILILWEALGRLIPTKGKVWTAYRIIYKLLIFVDKIIPDIQDAKNSLGETIKDQKTGKNKKKVWGNL
jgi:hypothetical protein